MIRSFSQNVLLLTSGSIPDFLVVLDVLDVSSKSLLVSDVNMVKRETARNSVLVVLTEMLCVVFPASDDNFSVGAVVDGPVVNVLFVKTLSVVVAITVGVICIFGFSEEPE